MAKYAAVEVEEVIPTDISKVMFNKETVIAFVRLIVPMICGVAATFGWSLDAALLFNIIVSVLAIILFVYAWWKNNNVTAGAQLVQGLFGELKAGNATAEAVDELVAASGVETEEETE